MSDQLSDEDKEIISKLLDFYLGATEKLLQRDKYIIPMAVTLSDNGEMSFEGLDPKNNPEDYPRLYRSLLKQTASKHKACLLGYDVRLKERKDYKDALAIESEVKDGPQVMLYLPYKFVGIRKKLEFGAIERIKPNDSRIY